MRSPSIKSPMSPNKSPLSPMMKLLKKNLSLMVKNHHSDLMSDLPKGFDDKTLQ